MRVVDVARGAGVTAETVRHYVREGLLRPERDPGNGYRVFAREDLTRLRFIVKARELGFSVREIRTLLDEADAGQSPCPRVREMADAHLREVRARLAELERQRARLEAVVAFWSQLPDGTPDGDGVCHLIESVDEIPELAAFGGPEHQAHAGEGAAAPIEEEQR